VFVTRTVSFWVCASNAPMPTISTVDGVSANYGVTGYLPVVPVLFRLFVTLACSRLRSM